jgi:Winged helix DNA-binding domain
VTVLSARRLNRAVLARQGLLARTRTPLPRMLERMGCLQAQYAPSMYVGLWSRLEDVTREQLTRALERRTVVQATLMRSTIHLVSRADYWPLALATQPHRQRQYERAPSPLHLPAGRLEPAMARLGEALAAGPLTRKEIEALVGKDGARAANFHLHLVRVPPSGTWERRAADCWGLAEAWLGDGPALGPDEAVEHLVRRYLTGFGPATRQEVANWCGVRVGDVAPALERLEPLRRFRAADGAELLDLPRLPVPDEDEPAPVRLLPTWDATLLTHARRAEVLPEADRERIFSSRNPHSFPVFLVDGVVRGTWRIEAGGRVTTDPWSKLEPAGARELRDEVARLEAWLAEG